MLKLTEPKSFLRFAKNMTVGELKNVTTTDIMEYEAEFTTTIKPDYDADFATVTATNNTMTELAMQVYGAGSKQHKYLGRNFHKGENLVDAHYSQFPSVYELETWVENSKSGFYEDYCVPAMGYARKEDN